MSGAVRPTVLVEELVGEDLVFDRFRLHHWVVAVGRVAPDSFFAIRLPAGVVFVVPGPPGTGPPPKAVALVGLPVEDLLPESGEVLEVPMMS